MKIIKVTVIPGPLQAEPGIQPSLIFGWIQNKGISER